MELDRQTIEKKDFPISRRGYDADAVDAHLAMITRQVETMRQTQRAQQQQQPPAAPQPGESLATAAAMQVQAIVEAAESTAAAIRRQAEDEARNRGDEATAAALQVRDDAVHRAESYVDGVSKAAAVMLQRVAAMESELGALIQSLRTGTDRLNADLALLSTNMGDLYDAAGAPPSPTAQSPAAEAAPVSEMPAASQEPTTAEHAAAGAEIVTGASIAADWSSQAPDAGGPAAMAAQPLSDAAVTVDGEAAAAGAAASAAAEPRAMAAGAQQSLAGDLAAAAAAGGSPDVAGARMIALNMALNGQPREEADRYLADNFDIPNRQALIDEVYSALDG